jgi:hypothetical protein
MESTMTLWKINCMEGNYPGMWHRWYRQQCVAVGWHSKWGHKLHSKSKKDRGWQRTRASLSRMAVEDHVVVALQGHRVGRIGQITAMHIEDNEWEPLVPRSNWSPDGEMGRRIHVRWDLACGPDDRDLIVLLPKDSRFSTGELRPTIAEIKSQTLAELQAAMNDSTNWVALLAHFRYERALSDYIAAYPHRLEDGLVPHPDSKVRERVFLDRKRLDVLLLDRDERPVIVECKQGAPTVEDLKQLRHYMKSLREETGRPDVRGILVHGGSRNLHQKIVEAALKAPPVQIVQYSLKVDFAGGSAG